MDFTIMAEKGKQEAQIARMSGDNYIAAGLGSFWLGFADLAEELAICDPATYEDFAGAVYSLYATVRDDAVDYPSPSWQAEACQWLLATYGKEITEFGVVVTELANHLRDQLPPKDQEQ